MRILLCCERFPFTASGDFRGGVEARSYYSALELAQEHEVTVIAAAEAGHEQEPIGKISVIRCGPAMNERSGKSAWNRLRLAWSMVKAAGKIEADVVEGTNHLTYQVAMRIAKMKRIPAVCTFHDLWMGDWRQNLGLVSGLIGELFERRVLKYPWTKIIAVSQVTARKLVGYGVTERRITVVPNGVDAKNLPVKIDKFERPTVIYVGRLVQYKRIADLIDAIAELRITIPDILLRIIGSGPERTALGHKVQRLGLSENVVFDGFILRYQEVLELIGKSHVLCLPSVTEGFGLVTIEAMALGTPYVSSDIPPTAEVTENGVGGVLYPPGNNAELVNALRSVLTDKNYAEQLGTAGKSLARERYDWRKIGEQLRAVYRSITPAN